MRNPLTAVAAAIVAGGLVLQLLFVPLLLLVRGAWWGLVLVPVAATTMPLWSLVHEAIHGTLSADRRWNDRCGRALAVGYGAPFVLLKGGHLLHHRYSRTRKERTEVFDPTRTTRTRAAPLYYVRLLGGLYLSEAASVLLAVLPRRAWYRLAARWDSPDTVTRELLERVAARQLRRGCAGTNCGPRSTPTATGSISAGSRRWRGSSAGRSRRPIRRSVRLTGERHAFCARGHLRRRRAVQNRPRRRSPTIGAPP
ncbi:hypothetical protein Val02_28740 [Virgisporangium aliadipatigenens]|uniref:Fatty acid desaturase domain-containing protein n=1 Tax=Virgisporangium aliadipatigenens TaxID=741659 RepID=A0A8J4DQQ9_9ACTN|nr:fatty acid desaturase [Virgisporangium aliadipatigenens]GIJ45988.1 hypothetical protein Val02_28740 [Virgisporangium aliadipatigenens]